MSWFAIQRNSGIIFIDTEKMSVCYPDLHATVMHSQLNDHYSLCFVPYTTESSQNCDQHKVS